MLPIEEPQVKHSYDSSTPPASTSEFNASAVRSWLDLLHQGTDGLIHICSVGNWVGRTFSEPADAADYVARMDASRAQGIYVRTTTLSRIPRDDSGRAVRGGADLSYDLPGFAADIDIEGPGHKHDPAKHEGRRLPADIAEAISLVTEAGLPEPTLWVHSGGGLYPWWLLEASRILGEDEGQVSLAQAELTSTRLQQILHRVAKRLGLHYGAEVGDLARVLRIPGTVNRKAGGAATAQVLEPASYEFYTFEAFAARIDEIFEALPAEEPTRPVDPPRVPAPGEALTPGADFAARTSWSQILTPQGATYMYSRGRTDYWRRPGKDSGGHSGTTGRAADEDRLYVFSGEWSPFQPNQAYNKFAAFAMIHHGGDFSAAASELRKLGYGGAREPSVPRVDLTSMIEPKTIEQAPAAMAAEAPRAPDEPKTEPNAPVAERPEIDLGSEQQSIRAITHAINSGYLSDVYVRDGQLVHVRSKTSVTGNDVGVAVVTADLLNNLLAHGVTTYRWVARRSAKGDGDLERKEASPTVTALRAVVSSSFWPGVPILAGVIGSPTLRPDGTLVQEPGYDKETGLYLQPTVKVDRVPDEISDEQLQASRQFVMKIFKDFCWSSQGDFANFMALGVSPMLRPYIKTTTPFGMISATTRGSGKTNLADAIGMLYGQSSQVWPHRSEELQKKITSVLIANSKPVVVFDNLMEGTSIRSEVLAGLVTKDDWDDRLLGASKNIEARNDRLWLATGNGLTVGGDMASRTVLVRLDPRMEHPELRTFEMGQFSDWIRDRDNRAQLMYHLIVLVRAWMQSGAPTDTSQIMRGFTRWAQIVGGFVAFHGWTGFLSNVDELASRDTDEEEWTAFLSKWFEIYGDRRRITSRELHASSHVDFIGGAVLDRWAHAFISDRDGKLPPVQKLGMMLFGKRDRLFNGYVLRSKLNNAKTNEWWVEHAPPESDVQEYLDLDVGVTP